MPNQGEQPEEICPKCGSDNTTKGEQYWFCNDCDWAWDADRRARAMKRAKVFAIFFLIFLIGGLLGYVCKFQ